MAKKKEFKLPATLAGCADMLYLKRAERLEKQKEVDEIAKHEGMLRDYIIDHLPKSQATGITGKVANARIELKKVPQIKDKIALQKYIMKNDRFDLLQNRISETAVLEMWADNKTVPGVEAFNVVKVSCTKK
jgi:hypothetical protein